MNVDAMKPYRRLAMQVGISAVALALAAGAAFSETPDREALADKLLMTRLHWYAPVFSGRYDGLWTFDPDTGVQEIGRAHV